MKKLYLFLLLLTSVFFVKAQFSDVVLQTDPGECCALYNFPVLGYNVGNVAYNPVLGTGTGVSLGDDQVSGALPIGFNFNFYGNTYSEFYISSNGFITFSSGQSSGCCSGQYLPDSNSPNNLIAAAWTDLDPRYGGSMEYFVTGTAPNRILIVNYNNLPFYSGGGSVKTQIVLFETSNVIEIHTEYLTANTRTTTMGVENEDGTLAVAVEGRNASNWSVSASEGIRFNPIVGNLIKGLPSGSCFPLGEVMNIVEIDDGEVVLLDTFTVTVIDEDDPIIVVNSLEVTLYQNGEHTLNNREIAEIVDGTMDNCSSFEDLEITISPKAFECVHVGEPIPVKVTVVDGSGNTVSDWTTITVYDETPPVALCKDLNLVLDENGKARINPSNVNGGDGTVVLPGWARTYNGMVEGSYDACGISSLNIDQYNFDCSDVGENTVTLTVVDGHGNTSTCESTVTISDNMVPVIEPVDDVELVIEPGNCDSELEYPTLVVNDNCETTLELTEGLGPDGVFPVGTTTETWLATDDAGNTASVSFDITIVATNALPTIDEQTDITVTEDTYSVEVTLTGITEGDDCEEQDVIVTVEGDNAELITSVTVDYTTGDSTGTVTMMVAPAMAGEAEIIVTVKDEDGGTISDTFMVTVTAVNDAPVLLHAIADETVNASYELKVPISSVLGEMFDDLDDDVLTIEVVAEGTDSLPTWAVMMGDTLVCTPTIADTGCVNIVVTATDAGGLSVSDTFAVCVDGYPVSIGDLGMNNFEVQMYPNPTRGQVNMDISSGIYDVELSVMDITGKVVLQKQFSASENITFDMSGKVSGMYFVKMNIDGNQMVKKLIVNQK